MIKVASIRDVKPGEYDEIWAIVRSNKKLSPTLKWVPALSPSWDLFTTYLRLKQEGRWNALTFESIYKPQFLAEMQASRAAETALADLIRKHQQGKKIALVCFCTDASLCHRSLIAAMLRDKGIPVLE